jgi:hypothetical protein
MPLILGANSVSASVEINSLRFNSGSSDSLTRTPASASNRKTWTFSSWVKRSILTSGDQAIFDAYTSGTDQVQLFFASDDDLILSVRVSNFGANLRTNAKFRDPSAWYHIMVAVDTTQGTTSNRTKLYVNGVQETSFSEADYPNINVDTAVNNTVLHRVGDSDLEDFFNGYLAETVLIDGLALDPTSFGEFDEDSGIWKPIDVSGLTFGTNGFYLEFKDSSALGDDTSGNSNDFTVNNLTSIDQTTDTPTNNFSTLNTLNVPTSNAPTFSEGNLKTVTNGVDGNFGGTSTIGISQGKWYAEFKFISTTAGMLVGVTGDPSNDARLNNYTGENILGYSVYSANGNKYNNASNSAFGVSWTTNDIIGVALDLDNHKIYFHKNGVYMNSGDPTSGATGTGSAFNLTTGYDYFFSVSDGSSGASSTIDANFGNAPFTISSGNSDANGYGNFEYAVPSGYYSLCTKNLAEYG